MVPWGKGVYPSLSWRKQIPLYTSRPASIFFKILKHEFRNIPLDGRKVYPSAKPRQFASSPPL